MCVARTRLATLTVRGREERQAFRRTATRVLSLADLITPAPKDEVTIERPGAGRGPIVLIRIIPAVSPLKFSIERKGETFELKLEMQSDIDAIRFSLENETGNREDRDSALAYRPVEGPLAAWLDARLDAENTHRILATVKLKEFHDDLSLANITVRPAGSETFRPLRNVRGDGYAIALKAFGETDLAGLADAEDAHKRFVILNSWMHQCFAQESWDNVGPRIQSRWMALGGSLIDKPGGLAMLLSSAHLPRQPGAARSWVPLAHPLQILVSLYGSPVESFRLLSADVSEGSEHLALLAETSGKTIPEIHGAIGLSPAFLMAFKNFAQAQRTNVELRGFRFPQIQRHLSAARHKPRRQMVLATR